MTATADTNSIESTTALLQAELPQLEKHQQTLEEHLAAVSQRLEAVRSALSALNALSAAAVPQPRAAEPQTDAAPSVPDEPAIDTKPEPTPAVQTVPVTVDESTAADRTTTSRTAPTANTTTAGSKKKAAPKKSANGKAAKQPSKKQTATKATAGKAARRTPASEAVVAGSGLTDQVIAVLARTPETPLRARDVAEALGRDDTTGNINTIRSTLDRLIATSRAHRAGRGLYQAPAN
ncbi:hypothetical protein [Streptomyces sp. NPDC002187]|uniref:hypothetical protein n=1 Tax=Streptomyces sp. NPDC002187 TaxID=3364637 RepID=UPI0036865E36